MANYAILRAEKLKTFGNIGGSLAHNYRDRETHNADASRTPKNRHTVKTSDEVMAKIRARLPEKRRKDAVLAIEYLITCTPGSFPSKAGYEKYLSDAVRWLQERHGKENVIAATIHHDETTPHLCAYVVPLVNGKLNAKSFLGGKKALSQMQTDFAKKVGAKYDLKRGIERSTATHTSVSEWYGLLNEAVNAIEIPASEVAPKVLKKRPILNDVLETPEQVAKRLTKVLAKAVQPVLQKAKMADFERNRVDEIRDLVTETQRQLADADARAAQAEMQAKEMRELYDCLTPSEQKTLVQTAKRNKRVRDRCSAIMSGAFDAAADPVRRFVSRAKDAMAGVAGNWWGVKWRDVERDYIDAEKGITGESTAVAVVVEHSPGSAGLSKAEAIVVAAEKRDRNSLMVGVSFKDPLSSVMRVLGREEYGDETDKPKRPKP